MRIPIPEMLMRLREESQRPAGERVAHPLRGQGAAASGAERMAWAGWRLVNASPNLYRMFGWAATRLRKHAPKNQPGWTQNHLPLTPAPKTLHELVREREAKQGGKA